MSAERVNSTELRVTFRAETATDALAHAERELRSEGYVPAWVTVSFEHSRKTWAATVCGSRVIEEPES